MNSLEIVKTQTGGTGTTDTRIEHVTWDDQVSHDSDTDYVWRPDVRLKLVIFGPR